MTHSRNLNYRSAQLPPHCGNCDYWLDDNCANPFRYVDESTADDIRERAREGGSHRAIARDMLRDMQDNAGPAAYDYVCDDWYDRAEGRGVVRHRDMQAFAIIVKWEAGR